MLSFTYSNTNTVLKLIIYSDKTLPLREKRWLIIIIVPILNVDKYNMNKKIYVILLLLKVFAVS